ncbi:MAG: SDR family oxidoreductase [Chloroflexi bacterium]|nr:SDR family oxidoreductase [Chloroflexota bacterium]MCL5074135.1 SDR family oxidoreductase [Chloroflexota bacterium]
MKILVTGGAGFIGSHLCEKLLKEGHDVVCVDNLITGSMANISHLISQPGFEFLFHDVTQPLDLETEAIFHLASPASPPGYLNYPLETSLVNSLGTYLLLDLAKRHQAKFLLASTSEAYGDPLEHPQREDYWGNVNPIGLRSCYDESKRFAESLTMTYVRQFDLDARIIRIFNCYGPHSDPNDGRVVPNFVTQALKGEPITVYGSGMQTRSLCYISDMVEGIWRAMFTEGTKGQVYNLGTPEEHTVLEFAELIKRLCISDSPIIFLPLLSEDDPVRRCPDISKAREQLGWEPKLGLKEGLEKTIAWFQVRLTAPLEEKR